MLLRWWRRPCRHQGKVDQTDRHARATPPLPPPFPHTPFSPPSPPCAASRAAGGRAYYVALCPVGHRGGERGLLCPRVCLPHRWRVRPPGSRSARLALVLRAAPRVHGCVAPLRGVAGVHAGSMVSPTDFNMGGLAPLYPLHHRGLSHRSGSAAAAATAIAYIVSKRVQSRYKLVRVVK